MARYISARDIAHGSDLPMGTIYWLAHRDGWDRNRRRPRGYLYDDVIKTFKRQRDLTSGLTCAQDSDYQNVRSVPLMVADAS